MAAESTINARTAYIPNEPGLGPVRNTRPNTEVKNPTNNNLNDESDNNNNKKVMHQGNPVFDDAVAQKVNKVLGPAKELASNAKEATLGLGTDTATVAFNFIKKLFTDMSPEITKTRTWIFGLGGVVASYSTLKSVIKGIKIFYGKRKDDFSSLVYGFDALLTGGLALGLISPFFKNLRNPFAKVIDGKLQVAPFRLAGALVATLAFKVLINVAQGSSIINKLLKIVGVDPQEIIKPAFDGVNWLADANNNPNFPGAGRGNPQGPPRR